MFIAGPCAIQSYDQTMRDAEECVKLGIEYFRAGVFKPRTDAGSFQGLGEKGMEILMKVKEQTNLKVVTELTAEKYIPLYENVDIIQIGCRNCQNFELLREAAKLGKTVLLKRGFGVTVDELLGAATYLFEGGLTRKNIIFCERGIKTFETATRNTLDISAIALLKQGGYNVIADPSHATGWSNIVVPCGKAAIVAGANGVMVEIASNPDNLLSDKDQAINYKQLAELKKFYDFWKTNPF